ncbi:hypothetical protein [Aphanizomenon flos-aquae]|uniref:hypothetical protein n=1 Tax=Aphanizomenon flos-aquae TaxID=1176 RepID=UPI000AA209FF|nr:hypothetical protein [Aphanizomenon flos-aquae]
MARQEARGKSEEGLSDFTFLYTDWFYCVHLFKFKSKHGKQSIQYPQLRLPIIN